jgi:hypothetical protein
MELYLYSAIHIYGEILRQRAALFYVFIYLFIILCPSNTF